MKKPQPFKIPTAAEVRFARQLKKIGRFSGHIVNLHVKGHKLVDTAGMQKALKEYSELIGPWAKAQSFEMMKRVSKATHKSTSAALKKGQSQMAGQARAIAAGLRVVAEGDIGADALGLMAIQVDLIQSIPLKAGQRAQELALMAVIEGTRASEIAKELQRSTEVSENDAVRIARTETARANSVFTEARATAVGSTGYIWRNSGDAAVRDAHKIWKGKKLDGQVFQWNKPPTLDDGTTGNPGTFPNCRCYPEPVFSN